LNQWFNWTNSAFRYRHDVLRVNGTTNHGVANTNAQRLVSSDEVTNQNPVQNSMIQLNGHDRFSRRSGNYFSWVQHWQHSANVPTAEGINMYSFGLYSTDKQPAGTCNFSRIDNAVLDVNFNQYVSHDLNEGPGAVDDSATNALEDYDGNLLVFTQNYNVLRIVSGMAGLAYSN